MIVVAVGPNSQKGKIKALLQKEQEVHLVCIAQVTTEEFFFSGI